MVFVRNFFAGQNELMNTAKTVKLAFMSFANNAIHRRECLWDGKVH